MRDHGQPAFERSRRCDYCELRIEILGEALILTERERDYAEREGDAVCAIAGVLWRRLVQSNYELGLARRRLREMRREAQ